MTTLSYSVTEPVLRSPVDEGPSRLINDETGETVGVAVSESMDVRIMQNAPYAANQH
jgi:hypothetical protein